MECCSCGFDFSMSELAHEVLLTDDPFGPKGLVCCECYMDYYNDESLTCATCGRDLWDMPDYEGPMWSVSGYRFDLAGELVAVGKEYWLCNECFSLL